MDASTNELLSPDFHCALLNQVGAFNSTFEGKRVSIEEDTRQKLRRQCQKAAVLLETPFEAMQRVGYSPFTLITFRTAAGYGILESLDKARETKNPCKVSDLAKQTGLDEGILIALLDHLCSQFVATEVAPDEYIGTQVGHILGTPKMRNAYATFHDITFPGWTQFYKSLAPNETRSGWEIGHNTNLNPYHYLQSHPGLGALIHQYFLNQFRDIPSWLDGVDFERNYGRGAIPADVVFVDIGGGHGQECQRLRENVPDLTGRVVLQDLPPVLGEAPDMKGVEKMAYDYCTEQPVQSARIYYFRQIFHNNSDANCLAILSNHKPAMGPHSVILIDEKVISDKDEASQGYTSALSLNMAANFRGLERKKRQWMRLFDSAGFVVREMREYTSFNDCIIAVAPKELA